MIKIVDDLLNWVVGLSESDKDALRTKDRDSDAKASTGQATGNDEV